MPIYNEFMCCMVDDANLENEQLEQFLRTVFLSRLEGDEFSRQMIVFVFYLNCTIMNEIYSINYFHSFLYLCNSITE